MKFEFVDYKSDLTNETLLAKITFRYCNNFDGKIYTLYEGDIDNNKDIVEELINQLTPMIINKKNAIILNLLVNPFFDELCSYLSTKPNISFSKIKLIKKHVFSYLCDENTKNIYSDLDVEGTKIYIEKNMYEKSKNVLKKLQSN